MSNHASPREDRAHSSCNTAMRNGLACRAMSRQKASAVETRTVSGQWGYGHGDVVRLQGRGNLRRAWRQWEKVEVEQFAFGFNRVWSGWSRDPGRRKLRLDDVGDAVVGDALAQQRLRDPSDRFGDIPA